MNGHPDVCVCYIIRRAPDGSEVLLGTKKTGLGAGKIVGPGGKIEAGETPVQAAIREVYEEVGLILEPSELRLAGTLHYQFPHKPEWSQTSSVFVTETWAGVLQESPELRGHWVKIAEIPLDRMWSDAKYWLPDVLVGGDVKGAFQFGVDNDSVLSWTDLLA